jgi:hypothetical protein
VKTPAGTSANGEFPDFIAPFVQSLESTIEAGLNEKANLNHTHTANHITDLTSSTLDFNAGGGGNLREDPEPLGTN